MSSNLPNPSGDPARHEPPIPDDEVASLAGPTDPADLGEHFESPEETADDVPPPPPQVGDGSMDAPLEHVVDDLAPKEFAADWVLAQMRAGRSPDGGMADLLARGWTSADADEVVEFVRRATRAERGVVTRDDVARRTRAKASASTRRVRLIVFGGVCIVFVAAVYFGPSMMGPRTGEPPPAEVPPGPVAPEPTTGASAPGAAAEAPSGVEANRKVR